MNWHCLEAAGFEADLKQPCGHRMVSFIMPNCPPLHITPPSSREGSHSHLGLLMSEGAEKGIMNHQRPSKHPTLISMAFHQGTEISSQRRCLTILTKPESILTHWTLCFPGFFLTPLTDQDGSRPSVQKTESTDGENISFYSNPFLFLLSFPYAFS